MPTAPPPSATFAHDRALFVQRLPNRFSLTDNASDADRSSSLADRDHASINERDLVESTAEAPSQSVRRGR